MKNNRIQRKKGIRWFLTILSVCVLVGGCAEKTAEEETARQQVTLEVMIQTYGEAEQAFGEICDAFTEETGILISYSAPLEGYEEILKTRMAVNDMPDVWDTHGWAVRRYKEYIRPLEDQPYTDQINPLIRSFLEDEEGNLCAFPVGMTVNGIIYNKTVLKNADLDPNAIDTWEDLTAAAEQIAETGVRPFALGGSDKWSIGCYFLGAAGAYFDLDQITDMPEKEVWEDWDAVCELLYSWREKQLILEDSLQNTNRENGRALGEDRAAFGFSTGMISYAMQANPQTQLGMIPYPAEEKGEKKSIQVADQISFAVNKDTPHEAEALLFLEYLARPECLEKIAQARKMPSGTKDRYLDEEQMSDMVDLMEAEEILKLPVFDRQYLPSGMWETLYQAGQEILYGKDSSVSEIADRLKRKCQGESDLAEKKE